MAELTITCKTIRMLVALCVFWGMASTGLAQLPGPGQVHLRLDPATTEVHYTLKDTLHTVHGTFRLKSGDVAVNTKTGEAEGLIAVDCDSGESGNSTRDGKMKREYLETARFPLATFQAQKVTGFNAISASQTISVAGLFRLHGSSHPLTLEFAVKINGSQASATTHFIVPYVAWGIKDPSIPFVRVEKEIVVDVMGKGTLEAEK